MLNPDNPNSSWSWKNAGYLLLAVNVINYVDIDKDKEPDMFQKRSFNLILRVFIM